MGVFINSHSHGKKSCQGLAAAACPDRGLKAAKNPVQARQMNRRIAACADYLDISKALSRASLEPRKSNGEAGITSCDSLLSGANGAVKVCKGGVASAAAVGSDITSVGG